jgi:coenzyme F420-reducing hydrogenase gamma subunit
MRIDAGVGYLVWRIEDDQAQVKYLVARQSGDWVTPYAIRVIHMEETRSVCFLRGVDKLIHVDVYLPRCPPKPEAVIDGLSMVWPQNHCDVF